MLLIGDHNDTTNLVLDHFTFMANLSEINKEVENLDLGTSNYTINMTLEYSARTDLQLENMSPLSWWNYVKSMAKGSLNGECNKVNMKIRFISTVVFI